MTWQLDAVGPSALLDAREITPLQLLDQMLPRAAQALVEAWGGLGGGRHADDRTADMSRWVKPSEVAEAMAFFLSDAASGVTGALLPIG